MKRFLRTDLACENTFEGKKHISKKDFEFRSYSLNNVDITKVLIKTDEGSKYLKRDIGLYSTVVIGKVWLYNESELLRVRIALAKIIKEALCSLSTVKKILIVGLGNRHITPDALGPMCIDKLGASSKDPRLLLLTPGVKAQTGIKALNLINSTVKATGSDCVILIDALASKSTERLCTTIQVSDSGLSPGSGMGENQEKICFQSVGVPVICIGAPTVVSSSSLVCDIFEQAGIFQIPKSIHEILQDGVDFFVSPKDSDLIISSLSSLISSAITMVLKEL